MSNPILEDIARSNIDQVLDQDGWEFQSKRRSLQLTNVGKFD